MRCAIILLTAALAAPASAQQLTKAEAAQLYAAGGFPISADGSGPVNRCGTRASPRISFIDVNEDKQPEALFIDKSPCYKRDGGWFAIAAKGPDGQWRRVIEGEGQIRATGTKANGWFVFETIGGGKTQRMHYNGTVYALPGAVMTATAPAAPRPAASAVSTEKLVAWNGDQTPAAKAAPAALRTELYTAAGVKRTTSGKWTSCVEDPSSMSEAQLVMLQDVNDDGREEALIYDSGSYCNGHVGVGSIVLTKTATAGWRVLHRGQGFADFVRSRGAEGYPDLHIGLAGSCSPYRRWNGREYDLIASLDETGKPCRPGT